ncbi:expressed unknown protein [Seminavis robusta]|uniref:Uncharacterized protein n=1 Tax=Seminavis robusta TaxID=568900 RepID=A0A9N8HHG6_9STRA|nr:expressed unknown protein [Seminavis robusta]|eukprot:Sro447_g144900.1 n/a (380) ;mRNA; r:39022-40612
MNELNLLLNVQPFLAGDLATDLAYPVTTERGKMRRLKMPPFRSVPPFRSASLRIACHFASFTSAYSASTLTNTMSSSNSKRKRVAKDVAPDEEEQLEEEESSDDDSTAASEIAAKLKAHISSPTRRTPERKCKKNPAVITGLESVKKTLTKPPSAVKAPKGGRGKGKNGKGKPVTSTKKKRNKNGDVKNEDGATPQRHLTDYPYFNPHITEADAEKQVEEIQSKAKPPPADGSAAAKSNNNNLAMASKISRPPGTKQAKKDYAMAQAISAAEAQKNQHFASLARSQQLLAESVNNRNNIKTHSKLAELFLKAGKMNDFEFHLDKATQLQTDFEAKMKAQEEAEAKANAKADAPKKPPAQVVVNEEDSDASSISNGKPTD